MFLQEAEESARKQEQERTKQLLQRILPQVSVDSKEVFNHLVQVSIANCIKQKLNLKICCLLFITLLTL